MNFRLVWRNLLAHPLRSALTFGSVAVALFLLCFLRSTVSALQSTVNDAAVNRLWVQSSVSLYVDLPLSYQSKIESIRDVDWVCKYQWFGGVYGDESYFFAQFGVDPDTFLKSYPELEIIEGSYDEFKRTRTGCVIGTNLAKKLGFKVGERIPIKGQIYPMANGDAWNFTVSAIYKSNTTVVDQDTLYFHYDYLRESLKSGAALGPQGVGVYMVKVRDGVEPEPVMAAIDTLYKNGPQAVQTTTEAEFNRQFISMLGNVPLLLSSIGGAVIFAIFFAVLNTMLMAGRERTKDIGILKALGFTDSAMFTNLLLESMLLCAAGGATGLGLAKLSEGPLAEMLAGRIPGFAITQETVLLALGTTLGLGIIAGIWPALRLQRLSPVQALRGDV